MDNLVDKVNNKSLNNDSSYYLDITILYIIIFFYVIAIKYKDLNILFSELFPYSYVNVIFGSILISLYLIFLIFLIKGIKISKYSFFCIFTFLLFLIITYLNYKYISIDLDYASDKLKQLVILFLFFLIPVLIPFDSNLLKGFLKITFYFNILFFILLIIFYRETIIDSLLQGIRFGTKNVNPIWIARILGENIIISLYIIKNNQYKIIIILTHLFLMITTGSKGPIFILILLLIYLFIQRSSVINISFKEMVMRWLKIGLYVVIIIIFARFTINLIGWDFIYSRLYSESNYANNGRINRYIETIYYFFESPIFGIGFGNWGFYFNNYFGRSYPHNLFLEILSELGIIGTFPILLILLCGLMKIIKLNRTINYMDIRTIIFSKEKILMLLYLYFLLNSMLSGDLGLANKELFVYLGIITGLIINKEKYL